MLTQNILSALGVGKAEELEGPPLSLFIARMEGLTRSSFAPDYALIWAANQEQAKILGYYGLNGDRGPAPPYRIALVKVSRRLPDGFCRRDFLAPARPRQLRYSEDLKCESIRGGLRSSPTTEGEQR